jgi:hypothetical protein
MALAINGPLPLAKSSPPANVNPTIMPMANLIALATSDCLNGRVMGLRFLGSTK